MGDYCNLYYIIFDLEWNSAYNYSAHTFMNEIIEIGAVKLDERLNIIDAFKQLLFPHFTRKLSSRTKRLTNITIDEIKENAVDFIDGFKAFAEWGRGNDNVYMSWSNSDLYVLTQNFIQNTGNPRVDFIKNYCDAQKYCMNFIEREEGEGNNQISLANCAERFGISVDTESLHRALTDCYITAECLKKVYDRDKIKPYIRHCDSSFFERLLFKPYYITEQVTEDFDINNVDLICPHCGGLLDLPEELTVMNKSFKGAVMCNYCRHPYWIFIRAKKLYDSVSVKTSYVEMNKRRARAITDKKKRK